MSEILTTSSGVHVSAKGEFVSPEVATGVVALLECSDYYLAHPPGQPKREIADNIEKQIQNNPKKFKGLKVPERFRDYEEAKKMSLYGRKVMARSEHPYEYSGISGLFSTIRLDQNGGLLYRKRNGFDQSFSTEEGLLKQIKKDLQEDKNFMIFCRRNGFDVEKFLSQLSFSYWEYIPGINHKVIRDDSIPERCHVLSTYGYGYDTRINFQTSYYIAEGDKIVFSHGTKLESDRLPDNMPISSIQNRGGELFLGLAEEGITFLIDAYKSLNHDSSHCPVVEMQTSQDEEVYFLQTHRCRDSRIEETIDLQSYDVSKYTKCSYVRGATGPKGITVGINPIVIIRSSYSNVEESKKYDSFLSDPNITCYNFPQTIPDVIDYTSSRRVSLGFHRQAWRLFHDITNGHEGVSSMFKPEIFPFFDFEDMFPGKRCEDLLRKICQEDTFYTFPLHIISDGRQAYVKAFKTWEELLHDANKRGVDIEEYS